VISFSEPGLKIITLPFEYINNSLNYLNDLKKLKQFNKELVLENEILRENLRLSDFYEIENFRLKKLLNVPNKDYARKITSRVLINPYRSNDQTFFIDLGKIDGLKINDIVFNEYGMIGRVSELGKYSSKVLSVLDEDSVIPVISKKTKKSFFVKGGEEKKLYLKHIEQPFELEHEELVLTTSAAGYFQKGISVGKVVKTLNDVYVEPFAKVSDSIFVNVLIFDFKDILE
tara:strand:+ start:66 stop:755 length:690 start_codon:yes stop_codon:yes gene_type:complete